MKLHCSKGIANYDKRKPHDKSTCLNMYINRQRIEFLVTQTRFYIISYDSLLAHNSSSIQIINSDK